MRRDYSVYQGDTEIGRVQVQQEGLYYRFFCRCKLNTQAITRLWVSCGEKRESLGVLVPVDDGFGLEAKIPASRFGQGEMAFSVDSKQVHTTGRKFCPIYPEEPFAYLTQLNNAFLVYQDGKKGILVQE